VHFLPENAYLRVEFWHEGQNPCHLFKTNLVFHTKIPNNMNQNLRPMERRPALILIKYGDVQLRRIQIRYIIIIEMIMVKFIIPC
jgi:hypothetical protein